MRSASRGPARARRKEHGIRVALAQSARAIDGSACGPRAAAHRLTAPAYGTGGALRSTARSPVSNGVS